MQFIKCLLFCSFFVGSPSFSQSESVISEGYYQSHIQKVFDNRCVACHSCFNAPCQLNLQNFNGFTRGANPLNVYHGTRTKAVDPTRLDIDAATTLDWHSKGFYPVQTSTDLNNNLFWKALKLRTLKPQATVKKQVAWSAMCASSSQAFDTLAKNAPELGMPYGFPALNDSELQKIQVWLQAGAPGMNGAFQLPAKVASQKKQWESYLNSPELRQKLISRYIYEHLFLAHLYFPESSRQFFRLVRSQNPCDKNLTEIPTRRPNDSPGLSTFYYCLKPVNTTIAKKTHLPFKLDPVKLARFKELFNKPSWQVKKLPSYESGVAENPFLAFADIPVQSRYQFLLDDARYHVASFIKGPVCNGSMAVNSIQEQFFVFFLDPQSDNMPLSQDYSQKVAPLLMLPGVWGSDIEVLETPLLYKKLVDHREAYRKDRMEMVKKTKPNGYVLKDIWDGDGQNPNAVLTVFRHDDNAVVQMGAVGDLSKTSFVLDYPLFERLVYNLVVNFDVFGNVSHQLLTRIYMDMIRMEAEELFLLFLPAEERLKYRQNWYQGFLAKAKMTYIFPTIGSAEPTGIKYTEESETKRQLVEKILFYRLSPQARGKIDNLNWRSIENPEPAKKLEKIASLDNQLSPLASIKAVNERTICSILS